MEMKRIIMHNALLMKAFCCTYGGEKKAVLNKAGPYPRAAKKRMWGIGILSIRSVIQRRAICYVSTPPFMHTALLQMFLRRLKVFWRIHNNIRYIYGVTFVLVK